MEEVHLFILATTALAILWADHEGMWYMLGKKQTLDAVRMDRLHKAVFAGLGGMILTGAIMVWPGFSYYVADPAFQLKMTFVLLVFLNGLFIGNIMHVATHTPFTQLTSVQKTKLIASGVVSSTGWLGAFIIGMFFL